MRRQATILLVDDEHGSLHMVQAYLTSKGFKVITANSAKKGLRQAYQQRPDVILLDVMMPEMDGYEMCRRLREMMDTPVIFLTAKGTLDDIVKGFSAGGDDYIVKPYQFSELLCRINAILRRKESEQDEQTLMISEEMLLDCNLRRLILHGKEVHLTPKEFELLRLLVHHRGRVLADDMIISRVWGYERIGEHDLVKQYIYRLRRKLEKRSKIQYIHTVWGEGYYFDPQPKQLTKEKSGARA